MIGRVQPVAWDDVRYQSGLRQCFPRWGGEPASRWHLARDAGAGSADLLAIEERGELVAGLAVNYRLLATPGASGPGTLISLITGAWTLPAARRQGCLGRLLSAGLEHAAGRGAVAQLSFVTTVNASGRVLETLGAWFYPSWYCIAPGGSARAASPSASAPPDLEALASAMAAERADRLHLTYPSLAAWRSQFLDRPLPVDAEVLPDAVALVERTADTDRVLLVVPAAAEAATIETLAQRSRAAGRALFCFVTDPERRRAVEAAGLEARPGYLAILPTGPQAPAPEGQWYLSAGDRM